MGRLITQDFCFDLPKEFIAQQPPANRDKSKLMVVRRNACVVEHKVFSDILDYFSPGDCLVINKTKVFPARLFCKKLTGGKIEILFLEKLTHAKWKVLLRENLLNQEILLPSDKPNTILTARITDKCPDGEYVLELTKNTTDIFELLKEHGDVPLPPYIKRKERDLRDSKNYQTVYAEIEGSVAAPTAGLHFTNELLNSLQNKGVEIAEVVLHVSWGTFRPVNSILIDEHKMLPEYFEVGQNQANKINNAKQQNKRVFAVGTTTVRTLESISGQSGLVKAASGKTELFIFPGYSFKVIDGMITNFHVPKSTPLLMVCALAGKERILSAYKTAMETGYRFYSYGDAMLIL